MTNKLAKAPQSFLDSATLTALFALISGISIIAFMPILTRFSESEISPTATMFHRVWIATFCLGLWQVIERLKPKKFGEKLDAKPIFSGKICLLLLVTGIFFAVQQVIWAWSITETSIANSALLHNLTPFFTTLGAWIIFGKNFDRRFYFGLVIAITGASIVGIDDFYYGFDKIQGDILAFLSAFFYAGYLLLAEQVRKQLQTTKALFYFCGIASLFLLPILPWREGNIFPTSGNGWLIAVGLAMTIVVGHGLAIYSLNRLSSSLVSVTMLLNPVLNGILGWLVFSESLDFYNLVAFPTILLGIYLATTSKSAIKK
jgi:drug/metabolite transporter (DMT)-like permease